MALSPRALSFGEMAEEYDRWRPGYPDAAVASTSLPVADGSVDAVLVADAWHWFDPEATMHEVRRVLRPGGWLGLVWNVVAEPVEEWEHALAGPDMYDRTTKGGPDGVRRRLPLAAPDELEFAQFDWAWDLTPAHRAANLATTSMAIAMEPVEREEWLDAARAELQAVCDAAGTTAMPVRHHASCTRWTPVDAAALTPPSDG